MLRIAFPKIKGVCSMTHVTRGFRTDSHYPCGKFDKLSHTPIRSKSNSNDEGKLRRTIIEFGFKANKPRKKIDTFENIPCNEEIQKKSSSKIIETIVRNGTQSNTCERLIAKMFGNDENDKLEELKQDNSKPSPEDVRLEATAKKDPVYKSDNKTGKIARDKKTTDGWFDLPSRILGKIGHVNITDGKNNGENNRIRFPKVETTQMYNESATASDKESGIKNVTTERIEDKLTQKTEHIDEIPVVGSPDGKVEGFNEKPKVLEENAGVLSAFASEPNIEQSNTSLEQHKQVEFDHLASRIANFPDHELDERLLKEMDKMKVSRTNSSQGGVEENFPEKETFKEEGKPSSSSSEEPVTNIENLDNKNNVKFNILDRLYPTYDGILSEKDDLDHDSNPMIFKPEIVRLNDKPLSNNEELTFKEDIDVLKSEVPKIDPSQVLIDPYDKKSLVYENGEDYDGSKQLLATQDNKIEEFRNDNVKVTTDDIKEPEYDEKASNYEQLNPNYVVTCNETCPISTYGLSDISNEGNCLKGTEVIYDEKFSNPIMAKHDVKDHRTQEGDPNTEFDNGEITSLKANDNVSSPKEHVSKREKDKIPLKSLQDEPVKKILNTELVKRFTQSESVINPIVDSEAVNEDQQNEQQFQHDIVLPKLNDSDLPLSELLKRVRERHRIEYCCSFQFSQPSVVASVMGKCGKKPPPCPPCIPPVPNCPPPAPVCPPPPPKCPAPCPPPPPACPKPCRPPPPPKHPCDPCQKFEEGRDIFKHSILAIILDPQISTHTFLSPICSYNLDCVLLLDDAFIKCTLTEEFLIRPQGLGVFVQEALEMCQFRKSKRRERFTRDYNPWTPIPSWPIPEKVPKTPLVCPKDGCKIDLPKPHDTPCKPHNSPKPCTNFPKKICSVADLVVFVFGERKPSITLGCLETN